MAACASAPIPYCPLIQPPRNDTCLELVGEPAGEVAAGWLKTILNLFRNVGAVSHLLERERARNKTSSRRVSPSVVSGNRCEREHALQAYLTKESGGSENVSRSGIYFGALETAQARDCMRIIADQADFGPAIDSFRMFMLYKISANTANANRNEIFEL
jgi:hypothetical protein